MSVTEATYRALAMEDSDDTWELFCGRLVAKPLMTQAHGDTAMVLSATLYQQLDQSQFRVRQNHGRLRLPDGSHYVPDVVVIPAELAGFPPGQGRGFDGYEPPMPLVIEVWSPSTASYDAKTKIPGYRLRGDAEIWFVHPNDLTVRRWVRRPDGSYAETLHRPPEVLEPVALPGVSVDLTAVFRL